LDEDLHGELAPPRLREAAQHRRSDLHQRRLERIADELEQPRRVPWTAIAFAATCGAVFIFQLVQHGPFPDERDLEAVGGLRSDLDAMPWRYFMANLLHGGVDHLSGNLLMWGFIGTIVERVVGWLRMLVLVLVGAAACSAGALVAEPDIVGVGASGVVFAAIGLAVALDPFARRTVGRFGWILLLLGIGLSTFAPGISAGGHVGGLLGGFAVGALIAVAWRIPHVSVPKGVPLYATQLVDRSAPLAPHRALTIEERLTHLDRQRQAGTLAPFEYERLRNVLLLRG
ncbi:MAG: aarA, partial [Thermoleophilia bacterium]|nr:aarA [Thermoleophilia bacterium]